MEQARGHRDSLPAETFDVWRKDHKEAHEAEHDWLLREIGHVKVANYIALAMMSLTLLATLGLIAVVVGR